MRIINARVFPVDRPVIENGYVDIEAGRIRAVGAMPPPGEAEEILNAGGGWLFPGFVDAHTHIGMWEDGLGFEGDDGNEDTDPATPQLRAVDAINMQDRCFAEAAAAGVTTVLTGPGSANPIGGQFCAVKTYGARVDDAVVMAPVAMKMALGENPKTVYHGKNQAPVTRMATAAIIREQLALAARYERDKRVFGGGVAGGAGRAAGAFCRPGAGRFFYRPAAGGGVSAAVCRRPRNGGAYGGGGSGGGRRAGAVRPSALRPVKAGAAGTDPLESRPAGQSGHSHRHYHRSSGNSHSVFTALRRTGCAGGAGLGAGGEGHHPEPGRDCGNRPSGGFHHPGQGCGFGVIFGGSPHLGGKAPGGDSRGKTDKIKRAADPDKERMKQGCGR